MRKIYRFIFLHSLKIKHYLRRLQKQVTSKKMLVLRHRLLHYPHNKLPSVRKKLMDDLMQNEVASYNKLLDRKFMDQLVDIVPAAKEGRIAQLFIATSNLVDGFGEDPDTEYDRRQVLNTLAKNVLENSGEVSILEQKDAPDEKSLTAILRGTSFLNIRKAPVE